MTGSTKNRIVRTLSRVGLGARVLVAVAIAGVISAACDVHGVSAPGTLTRIVVTPNATLAATATQQMLAVGFDADGHAVAISPTWTVGAGGAINAAGLFSAGSVPGLFANTVTATVGNISGHASITVTPGVLASITVVPTPVTLAVTGTQQFVAVGKDAAGNIVEFVPTWSVVAGGGAITQAGIFTAGGLTGTYTKTVQASNQGITAYADVIVTIGPLASITVTPNPDTLIVGAKQPFVAVGKDASGNTVAILATWSVATGGGTVDGGGIFTAGALPGTSTVKATSGTGLSGTATVVVTAGPLALITVTPNPATMAINTTQQFKAVGTDVGGNIIAITPVSWSVVASGGLINATGVFTAGTLPGTFTKTVRATSGGLSGFATVIVTSGPLANITVTPNPVYMFTNSLQQFLAVGKDSAGNIFVMKPVWSVVNATAGAIDTLGNFTSGGTAGAFNNTIQATSGLISGFATVNISLLAPPPFVFQDLGAATSAGILGATAITCGVNGTINADVMLWAGAAVDPACVIPPPNTVHAADATAKQAQIDMLTAFNTLMGLPCPKPQNVVAELGGATFTPGVYCTSAGSQLLATGGATLDGGGNKDAVFVFQVGSKLVTTGAINLIGKAQAKNVYWVVGSSATIGGGGWQGNILANITITLNSATTLVGRALAHTGAVTIGTGTITLP